MGNSEIDAQCLTNPNPSNDQKTWVSVNVCRTNQLPAASDCANAKDNLQFASCLNSHVQAAQTGKWQNYQLIGAEYAFWGATGFGAPLVGCWSFQDGNNPNLGLTCPKAKKGEESVTVTLEGTVNLANTTMETWMQKNINLITGPAGKTTNWTQQDCFSCHQPTTASYQGDTSHLFGRAQQ